MAALPFVLLAGLAWTVPGFWQLPALVAVLVVLGVVVLRIDWPSKVKTGFVVTVLAGTILAFALLATPVGLFVLPALVVGFALSLWRARTAEREATNRDAWRRELSD